MKYGTMTVSELIAALQGLPVDLPVYYYHPDDYYGMAHGCIEGITHDTYPGDIGIPLHHCYVLGLNLDADENQSATKPQLASENSQESVSD